MRNLSDLKENSGEKKYSFSLTVMLVRGATVPANNTLSMKRIKSLSITF